jgi:hypothetical protein
MVLEALLLIVSIPQMDDAVKAVSETPAVTSESSSKDSSSASTLPAMPTPKAEAAIQPAAPAQPILPVKPVFTRPRETHRQRVIWYSLAVVGHSGAAFDAWSTKRAVTGGYGQESNPFLRPFANSNAIYAATQVSPAFMDYLGKKMMVSQHRWVRKMWWVPQVAGASFSFYAGAHNVGVVH